MCAQRCVIVPVARYRELVDREKKNTPSAESSKIAQTPSGCPEGDCSSTVGNQFPVPDTAIKPGVGSSDNPTGVTGGESDRGEGGGNLNNVDALPPTVTTTTAAIAPASPPPASSPSHPASSSQLAPAAKGADSSSPTSTILSESKGDIDNPPIAKPSEQTSKEAKSVVSLVNEALPPSYQKEGYNFLFKLVDNPAFSLSKEGDIQVQGIDLEPYHITDFLRVAFLTHHKGEIPTALQEWLKKQSISFPTSQVKLRPKFVSKYSFRASTLGKGQPH